MRVLPSAGWCCSQGIGIVEKFLQTLELAVARLESLSTGGFRTSGSPDAGDGAPVDPSILAFEDFWGKNMSSLRRRGEVWGKGVGGYQDFGRGFRFSEGAAHQGFKVKQTQGIPYGVTHEKKGKTRPPTDESFFIWLSETEPKGFMEDIHDEIAEMIKEDLWPNPLIYLNNDPDEDRVSEDDDVELHPFWRKDEIVKFCQQNGIHVSAHTPLGVLQLLDHLIAVWVEKMNLGHLAYHSRGQGLN